MRENTLNLGEGVAMPYRGNQYTFRKYKLYTQPWWLFEKYWVDNLSTAKIGRICGVESGTIRKYMRKYEIATRTISEAHHLNYDEQPYWNRNWLYKKYWKQGMSMNSIARLCGRNRTTIEDWMDNHNIPRRSKVEWQAKVNEILRKRRRGSLYSRFISEVRRIVRSFDEYMVGN